MYILPHATELKRDKIVAELINDLETRSYAMLDEPDYEIMATELDDKGYIVETIDKTTIDIDTDYTNTTISPIYVIRY